MIKWHFIIAMIGGFVLASGCNASEGIRAMFPDEKVYIYEGKFPLFTPNKVNDEIQPAKKANKYYDRLNDIGIDKTSDGAIIIFNQSRFLSKRVVHQQQHVFFECRLTNTIRVYLAYQARTSPHGVVPFTFLDITEKFIQKHRVEYQTYLDKLQKIDLQWREEIRFFENGYEITVSESDYNKVVGAVGNIVYGFDWKNSRLRIDIEKIREKKGYNGWRYQKEIETDENKQTHDLKLYEQIDKRRSIVVNSNGVLIQNDYYDLYFIWNLLFCK